MTGYSVTDTRFDAAAARHYIFPWFRGRTEVIQVPIYEYRCRKCGEVFEAFQKITDQPLRQCKFCNGEVDQLISQSSFQFKGTGWYLTDYARKSKPSGESQAGDSKNTSKKDAEGGAKNRSSGDS